MFMQMWMSVTFLSLHVVTGPMTCVPTPTAPTRAIVTRQATAGHKIAVLARVSNVMNIKGIHIKHMKF